MPDWSSLARRLARVEDSLQLTWPELETLVGVLPASAAKHRAWWSGNRAHVRAWRDAGFIIDRLAPGDEVTFVRDGQSVMLGADDGVREARTSETATATARPAVDSDVLLVTCVKAKLSLPAPAKDLYTSPLFVRERRYAESRGVPWFILSAEHGLVAPDDWLAPYERYLPDTPAHYRTAWGQWVAERLDLLVGPLSGKLVEVHAGGAYVDAVTGPLAAKNARLLTPLHGLSMGRRLAWYDRPAEQIEPRLPTSTTAQSFDDAKAIVEMLLDRRSAITPAEFLQTRGAGLKQPGLYSWWVDDDGAIDLTRGLELPVEPGLIYAGLAGATRRPSDRRSTNTLWSRISGMHLGGRHEFSTFRLSLGSVLAAADGRDSIDENALTDWMTQHLTVRAACIVDADALGRLEADVLEAIDPPLNLQGMPSTPARVRLRCLRRTFGRG